ncbi:MAG TPA: rRNA maturation RNase YbeY [Aquifex aeolicus]|nr:rRNA maturation RNase YbeY [Aquifex aeolicus]
MNSMRNSENRVLVKLKKRKIMKRVLEEWAQEALSSLGLKGVELSIYITDDSEIQELNKVYRGKDSPTDVLSFPINEIFNGYKILGDIVISQDTAERQAKEFGHTLEEEVRRLLVHGIIHLLGYDHEKGGEEEKRFYSLESYVLSRLSNAL